MKRVTRWIAAISLLVAGLVVYLCLVRSSPWEPAEPRNRQTAGFSSSPAPKSLSTTSEDSDSENGPIMDKDRFGARFGLKNVEVHNVDACVRRRMEKWREAKGANAWVLSIEGKTLRMFIPALPLSPAQLRQGVEQALAEEIGATRARKICESEQGWKTMVQWGVLEYLLMDQDCVFTRTKEEGRLSQRELATFNVTFDQRDVSKGAMPRFGPELQLIEGYDYLWLAESHFFSWTAMAKAPSGYFCSEPILGVASRPKPSVVIEEELDTGKVTIRNLRGDGSVEHLNLNDRSPPSP